MTPLTEGLKLWTRGVLLNAAAMGIIALPAWNIFAIPVFVASLLLGLVIASPLIVVVSLLVKIFVQLPYPAADKFAWLLFALAVTAAASNALLAWLFTVPADILAPVVCGSMAAVVLAGLWTKSSLIQLNNTQYEQHLV